MAWRFLSCARSENGAAAVETALVFPVFIFFILAIIEFSRAYWIMDSMQYAIDEAGRYAMINITASDAQIETVAKSNLNGLNSSQFTVTSASTSSSGVIYKVIAAQYPFSFVAPGVLPFGNIMLSRSTKVPLL